MTHYLLTGSSGFIGRHLHAHLHSLGASIHTFGRSSPSGASASQHWQGDLLSGKFPAALFANVDVVIHAAGLAHQPRAQRSSTDAYFELNCKASITFARAAAAQGVRKFIFVSSVKAAGYDHHSVPNDETIVAIPEDAYGLSKNRAEQALIEARFPDMQVLVVRPCLVYGAGVKGNLLRLMRAHQSGWFPALKGGGIRSMVAVDDLCRAISQLSEAQVDDYQVFIVSDGERYTMERIGNALQAASNSKRLGLELQCHTMQRFAAWNDLCAHRLGLSLPLINETIDKLCGTEWYSADRLKEVIGWRPRQTLESLLPQMLQSSRACK